LITKSSITYYIQNHPPKNFLQKQKIIMSYTNSFEFSIFFTTHEIAYFDVPSYRMGMSLLFIHFHIMRQLIMLLQSVLS